MIHVLSVRYSGGLSLALQFDDDTAGHADLSELIGRSAVFAPLADRRLFERAFVDDGRVCWPGDLDVPAERLYALVHALPMPESLEQATANEHMVRTRERASRAAKA